MYVFSAVVSGSLLFAFLAEFQELELVFCQWDMVLVLRLETDCCVTLTCGQVPQLG